VSTLLQDAIRAQVDLWPDARAVDEAVGSLSYRDLETRSNQLARLLRETGCRRGDRVCVLSPRTAGAVVAVLAILKADAIYVPLDHASPPARLAKVVLACDPRYVLTSASGAAMVDGLFRLGAMEDATIVGALEPAPVQGALFTTRFSLSDLAAMPSRAPACRNRATNPAQILFTAAAHGRPRGVVLTHDGLWRFIFWANARFDVRAGERHSCHEPLVGELSSYAILGTLAAGATICPMTPEMRLLPSQLIRHIGNLAVTRWLTTALALSAMSQLDVVPRDRLYGFRDLIWHGESPTIPVLRYWMTRLPHVRFTALYGAPETTIAASAYTVTRCPAEDGAGLPIGGARPGETIHVLDDQFEPVGPNGTGELFVSGVGLSPGYWREPDANDAAFVKNPLEPEPAGRMFRTGDRGWIDQNGQIYVKETSELRVRRRGHRVELSEVEEALLSLGLLAEVAVVSLETGGAEGAILCCAFVPLEARTVTPVDLRGRLYALLPAYMIPSRWKAFERLSRQADGTANRDVIRRAFAESLAPAH
jgi:amino acid adenylation domain-containing protein